jgi:hypothetical protein
MVFRRAMQKALCLSPPLQVVKEMVEHISEAGQREDGKVDYRELARQFGARWVPRELQRQEDVALFAQAAAGRDDVSSKMLLPYVGFYVSVRVPTSTIDSLRFFESVVHITEGPPDLCHLSVQRMYEAGPAFREMSSSFTDVNLVMVDEPAHLFMRTDRRTLASFGQFRTVQNSSELFRTVQNSSEQFRTVQNSSEQFSAEGGRTVRPWSELL